MAEQPTKKADLKDVDLATGLDRVPELWNRHGNKVLIALTVVALGYALYTFRRNTAEGNRISSEQSLAQVRDVLAEFRSQPLAMLPPETYANLRKQGYAEASTALGELLGRSDDDSHVAQALLLQGDLAYAVSMMPDPAPAATRPALKLEKTPDQLLTVARESYQKVLDSYSKQTALIAPARLGLAAVAENSGDFEAAKKQYQALADDEKTTAAYRDHAKRRLEQLPDLARPMRIRATTRPVPPADLPPTPFLPAIPSPSAFPSPSTLPSPSTVPTTQP